MASALTSGTNGAVQVLTTTGLSAAVDNTVASYGVTVFATASWPGAAAT